MGESVEPFDKDFRNRPQAGPFLGDYRIASAGDRRARCESKDEQDAHHDPSTEYHLGNLAAAEQFQEIYRFLQLSISDAAILAF